MPDVGLRPARASRPSRPLHGHLSVGRGSLIWEAAAADKPSLRPTAAALSYWSGLAVGGRIPERRAIEPWHIAGLLPMTFFARRTPPDGGWRYTLMGGCLEAIVGGGCTKRPLRQVYPGRRTAGGFCRLFTAVAAERRARVTCAHVRTVGDMPLDVPHRFKFEVVHMPVLDRSGSVIIFGTCAFDQPVQAFAVNPSAL